MAQLAVLGLLVSQRVLVVSLNRYALTIVVHSHRARIVVGYVDGNCVAFVLFAYYSIVEARRLRAVRVAYLKAR